MEKITKNLVAAGCICSLAGLCMLGAGYVSDGWEYVKAADINRLDGAAKLDDTQGIRKEQILLEQVSAVDAKIRDFDFEIRRSEDENYYLSYCLREEKGELPMPYKVEQGTLQIERREHFSFLQVQLPWFGAQDVEERAILYVPEGAELERCKISMGENDLVLEDLSCRELEIKQHYGELKISGCEFGKGSVSLSDGDVDAEDFCFRDVVFNLHDSNVELKDGLLDGVKLEISDGEIEAEGLELKNEVAVKGHYVGLDLGLKKGQAETVSLILDTRDGDIDVGTEYYGRTRELEDGDKEHFEYHAVQENGVLKADITDGGIEIR